MHNSLAGPVLAALNDRPKTVGRLLEEEINVEMQLIWPT